MPEVGDFVLMPIGEPFASLQERKSYPQVSSIGQQGIDRELEEAYDADTFTR